MIAVALVAVGCSSSKSSSVSAGQAASGSSTATVLAKSMSVGIVLTDASGKPLYTYANDQVGATTSACTGGCASAWPPLTTTGTATAGPGVTGTLGKLSSGQVTWNGHPLYTFASDSAGGSPTGDGVNSFHLASTGGSASPATTPTTAAASGGYGY
jgi:predicted lipoprotein with Yx(FWY)xxD motif